MKRISCMFTVYLGMVALAISLPESTFPDARITVRVVDEAGLPISGAAVGVGFDQGGNGWIGVHESETMKGLTDTNGLFSAEAECMGNIGFGAETEGFYISRGEYKYPGTYQSKDRWEPWNPIHVVILKEIRHPIAMYVKRVRTEVPSIDESIGFDLQKGDWVAPYGTGITPDIFFCAVLNQRDPHDFDYSLTLAFPNDTDGIRFVDGSLPHTGSRLRSDHEAPLDGYVSTYEQFRRRDPKHGEKNNIDENRIYYLRVRTKVDKEGNIVSANYAKIYGDFLNFTYYFNPEMNDRNVEFDPDQNLFGGSERFAP